MSLILKQETASSFPNPSSGKSAIFVDTGGALSVKSNTGTVSTFVTSSATDTQVLFAQGSSIVGSANLRYDYSNSNLIVSGNISATNAVFTNVSGNGANLSSITGANVTGQVGNALIAGTIYTNAQPNITSVGTLTGLTVGNATANTVFGNGTINATGNANVGNIGATDMTLSGNAVITGNLTISGTVTYINSQTLDIVDPVIQLQTGPNGAPLVSNTGYDVGMALNYYTTAPVTSFMGWKDANLEFIMASNVTIGSNVATVNTLGNLRVGNIIANGQALTGITGANVSGQVGNALIAGTVYTNAQPNITSVGTLTSLSVTGNITNGNITGGNLVSASYLTGTLTTAAQPNITSVGTLTSLGVSGTVTAANITANTGVFTGNGSGLSAIAGANVSGAVAYATTANAVAGANVSGAVAYATTANAVAGANVSGQVANALVAGTVYTNSQPNITSVGTLTSLGVSGTVTAANITANTGVFTGNGSGLSAIAGANVSGQVANALVAGTVYTNSQPNITSVGTLANLSATNANITGNTILANVTITGSLSANAITVTSIADGNSNVAVAPNANVTISVAGTANVLTVTSTGANIAGTLNTGTGNITAGNINAGNLLTANYSTSVLTTAAQPNITSVGTLTSLGVNGTVTAVAFTANTGVFTGNGNGLSSIVGANVTGTVANATYALSAGTVTTNAQSNITSVGTLTGLTVGNATANTVFGNGTINATGNANVGNLGFGTGQIIGTGNISTGNANLGNAVNANYFIGSGNNLSNIQGANVTGQVGNALVASTVYTNAQPNITSVGTLTVLTVNGNVTAGNVNASAFTNGNSNLAIPAANGNVVINSAGNVTLTVSGTGANITGTANISGNANVGNLGTATLIATTGNITTVNSGLLQNGNSNITIAANANISHFVAGNATSQLTISATSSNIAGNANVVGNAVIGGNLSVLGTGISSIAGNLNMNNQYINNVTNPVLNQDVATKAYVDQQISTGINYHQPVNAATTTTLAVATSGTTAYVQPNGAGNGVGAYISTTGTFGLIDTVNIAVANSRILVKNESNAAWNGIYNYTNATAITRSTDTNTYDPANVNSISINDYFFTSQGNVNLGTAFVVSAPAGTITFGTSNIAFSVFSTSQVYSNGTGLGLSGTTFSIANTAVTAGSYGNGDSVPTYTVNQQGQLTAAANVAITANAGNLSGTILKSTVVTSSLTSVGTLGNLSVTSNISGGNAIITANTSSGNLVIGGSTPDTRVTVYGVGQSAIYPVTGNSTTTGTDIHISGADSSQTRITQDSFGNSNSYVAFTGRTARGSAATPLQSQTNDILSQFTGRGFSNGSLQFGNSSTGRVDIVAAENFTDTSRATNLLIYTTSAGNITPTATATFASTGNFLVTGTIIAPNITANTGVFTGNANGLTAIPGANVTGTVATATTAGTVTTAAQPNITSVGTLSSLAVTGNVTAGNANVTGQLISSIATGTAPLTVTSTTRVANLNVNYANVADYGVVTTQTTGVYYPVFVNANTTANYAHASNTAFSANLANGALIATTFVGALSGTATSATSATTAGTVTTAAQPNITSVGTLTGLTVSSTITGSVSGSAATVTTAAQPNITSLGTLTGLTIGNATANSVFGNGTITLNAGLITGNGAGLSQLAGANVTGTVATATSATNAAAVQTNTSTSSTVYLTGVTSSSNGNSALNIVTGITANYAANSITATTFTGSYANGNSNVNIPAANGNVNISAVGNANILVVTGTGANITGTANVSGNANVGNIGAATAVFTTGNITTINSGLLQNGTSNVTITSGANVSIFTAGNATAQLVVTSTGANIAGTANVVGNANVGVLNSAGRVTAVDNVIVGSSGGEGGQLVMGYVGISGITGQANSTWNIDVDSSNNFRIFTQYANGVASTPATFYSANSNVGFPASISASANVTAANVISTTNHLYAVATGISAAGTTQATATAVSKDFNVVSTVLSGNGVSLPTAIAGMRLTIINTSANALNVYPLGNGIINSQGANTAFSQPSGARLDFICTAAATAPGGQWYTLNATYG
jgi:hypothetical protein